MTKEVDRKKGGLAIVRRTLTQAALLGRRKSPEPDPLDADEGASEVALKKAQVKLGED